jgi:hypothetical protein
VAEVFFSESTAMPIIIWLEILRIVRVVLELIYLLLVSSGWL